MAANPPTPEIPAAAAPESAPELSIEQRLSRLMAQEDAPEAPPADPPPEEAPEEEQAAETEGGEAAEAEEPEAAAAEGDDTDAAPDSSDAIETTVQLAEAMEVEEGDLLSNLSVEIEGAPVALAEVIDGYKNRDAPILPADVEMMKANLTAAQATMESKYEQQHLELAGVTKAVMDQLTHSQLSAEEMRQLERDDPQEYMLTQMRQRQTQDAVHSAVQALQAETQRQDGIEQQQTAEFQKAEMAKVPARIPEWKDRKIAAKEAEYIEEYLRTMDFADADFAVLNDSRYIAIARQAMLYAKLMDGKKLTMQKVKRTPKRVAQPARNENAQQEQVARQRQSVRDKLKKTGRIEDAAAAIGGLRQP